MGGSEVTDFARLARLATERMQDENGAEADATYRVEVAMRERRHAYANGLRDASSVMVNRITDHMFDEMTRKIAEVYPGQVAKLAPIFLEQLDAAELILTEDMANTGYVLDFVLPHMEIRRAISNVELANVRNFR
jgi:hypothetical protein